MSGPRVDILLATYNGAAYLAAQLESLSAQSYPHWRLIVRDDGSSDATRTYITTYRAARPHQVVVLDDDERLGACQNFARLLGYATADYVMFCDQDDVWLPHKVEVTLERMRALEAQHGEGAAIMVHTDLRVVAADLRLVADSLWRYQHLVPQNGQRLNRMLTQNVVTGCTVMVNRALRELSLPIAPEAIMHDWWLGLCAAAGGVVGHLDEATLLYRQHPRNDTGAQRFGPGFIVHKVSDLAELRASVARTIVQARALQTQLTGRVTCERLSVIEHYARLQELSPLARRGRVVRQRYFMVGTARTFGLFLVI